MANARLLLLFLLSFSLTSIAQTKNEEEAREFFWGSSDNYKNANDIPEKWSKESAVIIYKNENYDFHKFGKSVTYKASIRKRIKLLDKAAVEEFSEFSFTKRFRSNKGRYSWKAKGDNVVGIKIIKPDGEVIQVNVDEEAIEVDGETKIAIANLEVGDIIDYYFYKVEPFKSTYAFGFEPVETTLGEEYPIMDFKLFFETENDFFINFNSYNGAPELKALPSDKKSIRRYSLEASDIEKSEYLRWFYPLVERPAYKFQVYFARSGKFEDRALAFLPDDEKTIKKSVSKEEILELYDNRFRPDGDIGDVKDFFKGKTFKNDAEKVTAAYYYMRHYYLTRFIEAFFVREADILYNPFVYYGNYPVFIQNQKQFIQHFTEFLKRHKIKYEVVVAQKRYDGPIKDLLIERNVNVLLKIHTATPIYAEFFSPHTSIDSYSSLIEGTDIYLLSASKNKIDIIENGSLPVSTYAENETKKSISLTINDDFSGVSISAINSFKGYEKEDHQYDRMIYSDYVTEDYAKYKTKSFTARIKNKKNKIKYKKELDALDKKLKDKQKERFENSAKNEFEASDIEDYTYSIDSTGRYGMDSYFTYSEGFKAKNILLKKAGPNYIVELGKLIGGQIDLEDKERERTENIHMAYPRCYNYTLTLNIPAGYTVSGLDNFNTSVDNKTGAFISAAKVDGDKLVVTTSKQYKLNYVPNSDWNLMQSFLDEAFQFTNEKILLKKN